MHLDASALYKRHARFVEAFLRRMGASDDWIEDLVQQVFLIAHRLGGYTKGPAAPTSWLAGIAIRELSSFRRTYRRRQATASIRLTDIDEAASPYDLESRVEELERARRIARALAELDPDKRAILMLFEFEGQSCSSIAAGLDVPVGTVYSRLHGARKTFEKAYRRLNAVDRIGAARRVETSS